ncbi:MAG TPA: glycoside hydrolase TIM-barrel-like domain-containing protein [Chloroflexia bacterium]|nr:glycoside hydrolase TIM-barrel-like domain-containing protein [Chloroflexia bacterium]
MNTLALWLVLTRTTAPGPGVTTPTAAATAGFALSTAATSTAEPVTRSLTVLAGLPTLPALPGTVVAASTPTPLPHVLHPGGKMRGLNIPVWAPDFTIAVPQIYGAAGLDANWVALVSHWYVTSAVPYTGTGIFRETGSLGKGENRTVSDASLARSIEAAHAVGLKVLLKPHVDWTEGGWRGFFYFNDTAAREEWWTSYRAMITSTLKLAMDHGVEGICIGTELNDINKEPASAAEWTRIIADIRAAGYTGQLTYAANWGLNADAEHDRPGLAGVWEQLDFIGVDAYYPLSDERDPSVETLVDGWRNGANAGHQDHFAALETLHARTGKPVVFTEVGYPAKDFGPKNPVDDQPGPLNAALQARAAQALYQVWGAVPWWNGAFWWQYGPVFNSHSLQGRPVLDVLRQAWTTEQ